MCIKYAKENTFGTKPSKEIKTLSKLSEPIMGKVLTIIPEYSPEYMHLYWCDKCGLRIEKYIFAISQLMNNHSEVRGLPCPNVNCKATYTIQKD